MVMPFLGRRLALTWADDTALTPILRKEYLAHSTFKRTLRGSVSSGSSVLDGNRNERDVSVPRRSAVW